MTMLAISLIRLPLAPASTISPDTEIQDCHLKVVIVLTIAGLWTAITDADSQAATNNQPSHNVNVYI